MLPGTQLVRDSQINPRQGVQQGMLLKPWKEQTEIQWCHGTTYLVLWTAHGGDCSCAQQPTCAVLGGDEGATRPIPVASSA